MSLLLNIIGMGLICLLAIPVNIDVPRLCNGKANLCDRPYNKIAQIDVHNATSTLNPGLFNIFPNPVADQKWDLNKQLEKGLRMFKLPIHPVEKEKIPWVTHTLPQSGIERVVKDIIEKIPFAKDILKASFLSLLNRHLWRIDSANVRFINVLKQLKSFLDTHPHEVITLELNTFTMQEMKEQFLKDFKDSGIDAYIYKPSTETQNWPTLSQMIDRNERLVVLCDELITEPGFLYSRQYTTQNKYGYRSLHELDADDCSKAKHQNPNILLNMTHNITGRITGNANFADEANKYEVLTRHISKCFNVIKRYPNFISIDFVDKRFDDLQRVVDELNSKEW